MTREKPIARLTPYELVFGEGDFESRVFPRILEEAAAEGVDAASPERFSFLSTAADLVRQLTPEEAPPEALDQYRALLYHAFHFWRHERSLLVLTRAAARYLVEAAPQPEGWSFSSPSPAGYVQLPENLFWGSIAPDAKPEPVDGIFYSVFDRDAPLGAPFRQLEMLMVMGIRRSRAGFSVIPLSSQLGPATLEALREPSRPEGDFSSMLPGGELANLYSLVTSIEVLKLLVRTYWYAERHPEDLVEVRASAPREEDSEPPPTRLAYRRLELGTAIGESGSDGGG